MASSYRNRSKLTAAPALVQGVINTIDARRNGSIFTLQDKMETTSQWLDEAITVSRMPLPCLTFPAFTCDDCFSYCKFLN